MAQTISTTIATLVSLTLAADDPTTITSTGVLEAGLSGDASRAWEVVNGGTVSRTVAGGSGIRLLAGGTVTNSGAASKISGNYAGIRISGEAGTISNGGTVSGAYFGAYVYEGGTVTNLATGTITGGRAVYGGLGALTVDNAGVIAGGTVVSQSGVRLRAGGSITNRTTGTITGHYGAHIQGSAGTIDNAGTILGGSGTVARAIRMTAGGTIVNQSGALISGFVGIEANGTAASVANDGTIVGSLGTQGFGIGLEAGGVVTNSSGGSIIGRDAVYVGVLGTVAATIVNAGVMSGATTATGSGVRLGSAGTITNQAGGTITGYLAILSNVTAATVSVSNAGIILGDTAGLGGYGVYVRGTGVVTNLASGTITGRYGVSARNKASTIENAGRIDGGTGVGERGVYLGKGGTVTNLAGGTITGNRGAVLAGAAATLRNAGTISGSTNAVLFGSGFAHTLIADVGAVFSGTVNGGNAIGSPAADSTMVLASAASAGTIGGLGTQFINFEQTKVDTGANWVLTGTNALADQTVLTNNGTLTVDGGALTVDDLLGAGRVIVAGGGTVTTTGTVAAGGTIELGSGGNALVLTAASGFSATIAGFGISETITLTGVTDAVSAAITGGNTLVVDRSGNPDIALILDSGTNYAGVTFTVGDGGSDFITTDLACFVAGTRIDTPEGPVAVEDLAAGQLVLTASGETVPVKWIGWRALDLTRHPDPRLARPIRVRAGAFADGMPVRDLLLSPDHALYTDGVLVPARLLVNHATIVEETTCQAVTYFHVELDVHDILLAEGMPAESYLDTGNRGMFANAGLPLILHPDLRAPDLRAPDLRTTTERGAESCAPVAETPDQVQPIWQALVARAEALGHVVPRSILTDDPAIRIEAAGRLLRPVAVDGETYVFALPAGCDTVRLLSRASAPSDIHPWHDDRRLLGLSVRRIRVREGQGITDLPLDHPDLTQGWWTVDDREEAVAESPGDGPMAARSHGMARWTDGSAILPVGVGRARLLEITAGGLAAYAVRRDQAGLTTEISAERAGSTVHRAA